jgi:cell division protein FtsN
MFQERDGEKEILLGNKQLLGIFFLLAILFCVFFTAGYMVGRSTGEKKPAEPAVEAKSTQAETANANGGETHAVSPDPAPASSDPASDSALQKPSASTRDDAPAARESAKDSSPEPLGSRKKPKPQKAELTRSEEEREPPHPPAALASAGHNTYLQVAALGRADAEAVAKVLNKKGFRARIAPKPGTQYYRVLVGPVRDAGELNSTRDALKNKGFREVFVQHL